MRKLRFVNLSNCQMNRPENPFLAPKYELVSRKGLLGRFTKYRLLRFVSQNVILSAVYRFLTDG